MSPLLWFRQYCRLIDDERIRLLAFEDRWHYVAINCCKGQGILDNNKSVLLRRMVGVKLGLQMRDLEAMALRLGELDLIDPETFQPQDWNKLQFVSDSSTERVRAHRARVEEHGEADRKARVRQHQETKLVGNVSVTAPETETDTEAEHRETTTCLDWSYLSGFSEQELVLVVEALEIVPGVKQQDVLDELAGALRKGVIKSAWPRWLRTVAENAAKRDFKLNHGLDILKERVRKTKEAEQYAAARDAAAEREVRRNDPQDRKRRLALLTKAKADAGMS